MEHYDLDLFKIFVIIIIKFKIYFEYIWLRMYWVHLGVLDVTLIS